MKFRLSLLITVVLALLNVPSSAQQTTQTAKVVITKDGFEPGSITLKPNVPAKITFLRTTNDTCATSIVINEYKIKKDLPLNEPVVIDIKPTKSGEFSFTCGMFMLKGKLVVTEN